MKSDCRFSKVFWFNWIFLVCFFLFAFSWFVRCFLMCRCVIMMSRIAFIFILFFLFSGCYKTCSKNWSKCIYILLRIGVPFSGQWERCQLWESSSYENVFFMHFVHFMDISFDRFMIFMNLPLMFIKNPFYLHSEHKMNCQSVGNRRYPRFKLHSSNQN